MIKKNSSFVFNVKISLLKFITDRKNNNLMSL